jgi:hypothetical protein
MAKCHVRSPFTHQSDVIFVFFVSQTLYDISSQLSSRFGCAINRSWVCRMYKRWRWSFKNTNYKHIHKYQWANIHLYGHYLVYTRSLQMMRIKFMDEASFSSRSQFIIAVILFDIKSFICSIALCCCVLCFCVQNWFAVVVLVLVVRL